jgi:hypothetical protein
MAEASSRKTPARKTPAPAAPLLAGLPALERLLTAAAEWLEGVNEERKTFQIAVEEAEAAVNALAENDHAREREESIQECALGPHSLVGSWFHKLEGGNVCWQGSVVAEPQPGVYLLELHNWQNGKSAHQRLVSIREMAEQEAGWEYRWYDEAEWMRLAGMRSPQHENVDLQEGSG